MYARAGAILPRMHVDDQTMNVLGKRADGSTRNEVILRVYASATPSSFTLYEDDGETVAYRAGAVRRTNVAQQQTGAAVTVAVAPASGAYSGAPAQRTTVLELVVDNTQASGVTLNGAMLPEQATQAALDGADNGWFNAGHNRVLAKSGVRDVNAEKTFVVTLESLPDRVSQQFVCGNGDTVFGQSVYAVGNIPELGGWKPAQAVKLEPDGPYPTWTGTIHDLPPSTAIEWKCIKRPETASSPVVWNPAATTLSPRLPPASGAPPPATLRARPFLIRSSATTARPISGSRST